MGLIMLVGGRTFFESILQYPHNDSNWAALYLVGVVFYLWKNIVTTMRSGIFVLVAAVCHYVAILLAVVNWLKKWIIYKKNKEALLMEAIKRLTVKSI
jgi:hypothetical protein